MRLRPFLARAALMLAGLCSLGAFARGDVFFGNFAPGTEIWGEVVGSFLISPDDFAAVAFTVGPEPIVLTSLDLALSLDAGSTGFAVTVTAADLPTPGPALVGFTPFQSITATPARITFAPTDAVTLAAGTTYHLQLQSFAGTFVWNNADNAAPILSDYSNYVTNLGGIYTAYPGTDKGAYYITASPVPEPATAAALGGMLAACAAAFAARRRRRAPKTA